MDILNYKYLNNKLSLNELANILNKMYNSDKITKITAILLFGILFGETITNYQYDPQLIIDTAGLKKSLVTELRKGIKLAEWIPIDETRIEELLK